MVNLLDNPNELGVLSLGLRLLASDSPRFGQALGTAGLGAMGDMQQAKQAQAMAQQRMLQQETQRMQLEQLKRQQDEQDRQRQRQMAVEGAYRGALESPAQQALAAGGGPTVGNAQAMQGMAPRLNQQKLIEQLMQADPMLAAQMLQPAAPMKIGKDDRLIDPTTRKVLLDAMPDKPEALPSSVREYQFAQQDPAFGEFLLRNKKAGATNIGLPKIDIKVGESTAAQIGPMLRESREKAIAGVKLVDSGNRVLQAVEAGNVIAGPLANLRLRGAQAADVLGIGGSSNAEKIANTRSVVRAMAEQAVAARSQLGGQAQISNSEQELLTRATAGDIADLTIREVKQIADLNITLGQQLHSGHEQMMRGLAASPGTENLRPYFQAPTLPATKAPVGPASGAVRKYNPATGRIE